jgi:hypothetical protein
MNEQQGSFHGPLLVRVGDEYAPDDEARYMINPRWVQWVKRQGLSWEKYADWLCSLSEDELNEHLAGRYSPDFPR